MCCISQTERKTDIARLRFDCPCFKGRGRGTERMWNLIPYVSDRKRDRQKESVDRLRKEREREKESDA